MRKDPLILNVDDDDGARYVKTRVLQVAGFEVIEAATGGDALEMVARAAPDLVLLDVKLPDINGLEVCRRIKSDPSTASILVLQTSAALIHRTDRVRALDGGADNYLVAPIEAEELVANVNAMLRLRRVQGELLESEERFRQLAENIDDVFWMFAPLERRLLYVSPAFELLWGRPSDTVRSDIDSWIAFVHEQERGRVREAFGRLAETGVYDEEFRIVLPDNSVRWVRDRAFQVKNTAPGRERIARVTSDISARKAAEKLRHDADSRKDEFLATLAHELRNPLGPIRSAVDLLRIAGGDAGQTQERARDMISRQVDHLVRLVDDLLDISRISQGKITLQPKNVALASLVSSALETASPFITAREHQLNVLLPEQDVWVYGDAVRLSQVLGNLLHNAAKYTPKGGTITLNAAVCRDELMITVKDTGIGITLDAIDGIFDLFAQGAVAPDRAQDGLGVGLSLVKKLVQLHNGRVYAYSAGPGTGSTFSVCLPLAHATPAPGAAPGPASAAAPGAARKQRVLVVDDNPDAVEMMQMLLDASGYETASAYDAPSALERARAYRPDTILLDIGLPGMSGYDAARALRAIPEVAGAVMIALTGYGQARDRELALEAGFDHHLVKPVSMAALLPLLEEVRAADSSTSP
ncbi:MAG TPA: response regulator [Noviherbaspirillum sp.]|jgi:PAS domain S-box-containing protein|uniref:hybrid sensor histidine kinase/response regulator n=1 Tax=Noviherbaspirillum sp. TaxID=1926288 RepID=UPI002F944FD5